MSIDKQKMDKIKKFAIISTVIFSVVVVLSLLYFTSCNSNGACSVNASSMINICIMCTGIIGIGYCFMMLKGFDKTIDKSVSDYKEILLSEDMDKDNKLSYEGKEKK